MQSDCESVISDNECSKNLKDYAASPKKVTKRKTLVSAWFKGEEFHQVFDWLFDEKASKESKKRALGEMIIWKTRRSYLTPVAILSTIAILETELKDDENQYANDEDMQVSYAHSFTRFLNLMSSTVRSPKQRTLYEIAKELKLEALIVDLRHMCAHGTVMPPLEILRKTSHYCYNWLRDTYWIPQRCSMTNVDEGNIRKWNVSKFDEEITLQYQLYDSALQCYLKGAKNLKSSKQHLHGKRYSRLKSYYELISAKSLSFLMKRLVKNMSVLIRRQDTAIRDSESIFTEAFLKAEYFLKVAGKHTDTDQDKIRVLKVTNELFQMLASYGLIEDLYRGLMTVVENSSEDKERRKGASFWANELVRGFVAFRKIRSAYKSEVDANPDVRYNLTTLNKKNIPHEVKQLLKSAKVDVHRTLIFGDSTRAPGLWLYDRSYILRRLRIINEYSLEIVKNLIDLVHPELSGKEVATIRRLIDIQFGNPWNVHQEKMQQNITDDRIYTVEDLNCEKINDCSGEDESASEMQDEIQKYGIWSAVPDWQEWSTTPLGRLPWGSK